MGQSKSRPDWRDARVPSAELRTKLTRGRSAVRVGEFTRMEMVNRSSPRAPIFSGPVSEHHQSPRLAAAVRRPSSAGLWPRDPTRLAAEAEVRAATLHARAANARLRAALERLADTAPDPERATRPASRGSTPRPSTAKT